MKIHLTFFLLLLLLNGANAQNTKGEKSISSPTPSSRAYLEVEMNDLGQSIHATKAELAYLKSANQEVIEMLSSLNQRVVTKAPNSVIAVYLALKEIKLPPESTEPVGPFGDDPSFRHALEAINKALDFGTTVSVSDIATKTTRLRTNTILTPYLETIPIPNGISEGSMTVIFPALFKFGSLLTENQAMSQLTLKTAYKSALAEAETAGNNWESRMSQEAREIKNYLDQFNTIISGQITLRQEQLNELSKNAESTGRQISNQADNITTIIDRLPWLIGILCALFVLLIFIVRLFPADIQVEWVASGQVIQLLTVVTLLLIILCLAVGHLIQENTIGTLLGGIGGYVLAQGVGRAAAREANRIQPSDGRSNRATGNSGEIRDNGPNQP